MRPPPARSWGRTPRVRQDAVALVDRHALIPETAGDVLPWGNGRSYGDSCQVPDGTLLMTRGLDRYIAFDSSTGLLECEAGLLLSEILAMTVPLGWFFAVTPGTRFVTIGGAIANDVHGKNHRHAGSFGDHVDEFELLRSDGTRLVCSREHHPDWFAATVGGLGLTGLITRARLRLRRIAGTALDVRESRFSGLDGFFDCAISLGHHEYCVAWVDSTAKGSSLGRGIMQAADHAAGASSLPPSPRAWLTVPFAPPVSLINPPTVAAFNVLHYSAGPRYPRVRSSHYEPFFYPLDALGNWNRLYGSAGFLQYQCVVPPAVAADAIRELLDRIARSGSGSFLTVLKQFGERQPPGLLSFARPGTTLAIDFAHRGPSTLRLLDELDEVTLQAGGAIYPAKDARMSAGAFEACFPGLAGFLDYVDPRFSSGLWRRVRPQ